MNKVINLKETVTMMFHISLIIPTKQKPIKMHRRYEEGINVYQYRKSSVNKGRQQGKKRGAKNL